MRSRYSIASSSSSRGCEHRALPTCLPSGFHIGSEDEDTLHDASPQRLPFSPRGHRLCGLGVSSVCALAADVEDLLAERGVMVSRETVGNWVNRFDRHFADCIKRDRLGTRDKWHLDEVVVPINGEKFWLWRALPAAIASPPNPIATPELTPSISGAPIHSR